MSYSYLLLLLGAATLASCLVSTTSTADVNVLPSRFGWDEATNTPMVGYTKSAVTIISCPTTYPAVIEFTADGSHALLADCDISGTVTIQFKGQTNTSLYENTTNTSGVRASLSRFDMVNNIISAPVMILGAVSVADATTINDTMSLSVNISKNTARFDKPTTGSCSGFAMGVSGKFIRASQIEIFSNDLSKVYGNHSDINAPGGAQALGTGTVGSLQCAVTGLYTTLCSLDTDQTAACRASIEFTVGGAVAPFMVSGIVFSTSAMNSWVRIHSNVIKMVLDPVTLVSSASPASTGPVVFMSGVLVVSSPEVYGNAAISFDSNDIEIYTAINANVNSDLGVVSSAVYVGQSSVVKSSGEKALIQFTENNFNTGIIDALNGTLPTGSSMTVSGGQKSTMCFIYFRPSVQFNALGGSQHSFSYNLVTMNPVLPSIMHDSTTYKSSVVSNVSRVGFADVWSQGGASIKFEATASMLVFNKNMVLVENIEAVGSAVIGMGFIPDGLTEDTTSTQNTKHLMQVTLNQNSRLSLNRSFVRLYTSNSATIRSLQVSSAVSGSVTTNTRRYIPFIGISIPASLQLLTSSYVNIDRNVAFLKIGVNPAQVDVSSTQKTIYEATNSSACIGLGGGSSLFSQSSIQIGGNTLRFIVLDLNSIVARPNSQLSTSSHSFMTMADPVLSGPDSAKKYIGPFIVAAKLSTSTGSNAGFVLDSLSTFLLLENTAQVFDSNDSPIDKAVLGNSRTPAFIAGILTQSVSTAEMRICSESRQEFLGVTPIIDTEGTITYITDYMDLNNNSGSNAVPVLVPEADCLPVMTVSRTIPPVEPVPWVESDREYWVRIRLSSTLVAAAALLVVAMVFGGCITELQLFVAMYLSKCGSQHDELMMYVLQYFYSFFIDFGERDVIIAHSIIGPMVAIIWLGVVFLLSKLWEIELFELCKQLCWPVGPLYVIRFLYPALVVSSFRIIDTAGGIIGVIIALGEAIVFLVVIIRTDDRYFKEQVDIPESLVVPNSTYSLHRGFMFLYTAGISRPFAFTPIFISWVFALFMMDKIQEALYGCVTGFVLIFVVCVLMAFSFIGLRPHGTVVRSGIYAWIYIWLGCTGLAIYTDHLNAKLAFAILFFIGLVLLALHTVLVWVYVFCMQDSEDLVTDQPMSPDQLEEVKRKERASKFEEANKERSEKAAPTKNIPKKASKFDDDDDAEERELKAQRAKALKDADDIYYGRKKEEPKPKAKKSSKNEPTAGGEGSGSEDSDDEDVKKRRKKEAYDKDLAAYYGKGGAPQDMKETSSDDSDE